MSDADLEALYYDPLCRRVVDVFAEAALAKRPTIKFSEELEGHDEVIRNIEQYLEDSEAFFYVEEALKLQRMQQQRDAEQAAAEAQRRAAERAQAAAAEAQRAAVDAQQAVACASMLTA